MEFPTYSGEGDPLGWIKRCEKFFANQRTTKTDKVGLAAFHLVGEAQLWFDQMEQEELDMTWKKFKNHCHIHFGPPMSNNPLGELANLKQTGLVEDRRIDIELQKLENLGIAMNMTRALEWKSTSIKARGCYARIEARSQTSSTPAVEVLLWRRPRHWGASARILHLLHSSSCKLLFWIEVPDDDREGEEEVEVDLKISLYALLVALYLAFELEDKLSIEERSDDMDTFGAKANCRRESSLRVETSTCNMFRSKSN
ncbi:hypothetical protein ZIOFF_020646 [Zingiber officinale]|uniref:Retrotransposon gag domain-containing protein n=1 Tax=Zingiber officinale TaxID=94328 RepID=A0A8J5HIT1_ZINOF|nr:hypothetical protein ZIOFF_020646 [Zingiber officinale]